MKKIKTILILLVITFSINLTYAITTPKIENQKNINANTADKVISREKNKTDETSKQVIELTNRYVENIRTCEPFAFQQALNLFGFKMNFSIDIAGWNNGKCKYSLSGKISSLGKDIKEVFNIDIPDENIGAIEPKLECNFSKSDLNSIAEALIERNKRNEIYISQMLKNPDKKYVEKDTKLTPAEEKVISILTNGQSCNILNKEELFDGITKLMAF